MAPTEIYPLSLPVVFPISVITGNAAGLTVIVLDTDVIVLPHASVAVHVSVTVPPHAVGVAENVDGLDVPLIRHGAVNPLLYVIVLAAGIAPHATVVFAGAVIVGNATGIASCGVDADVMVLAESSNNVHVSVTVPPHPLPGNALYVDVL